MVLVSASEHSSPTIETLADAVWASESHKGTARSAVDSLYSGLEDVPANVRARVLANRVFNDQIETAVLALAVFVSIGVAFCIPIIAGTVIGMLLLERDLGFFGLRARYVIAWLCTTALLAICGGYVLGTLTGTVTFRFAGYHTVIVVISAIAVWLTLKRPRMTVAESETTEANGDGRHACRNPDGPLATFFGSIAMTTAPSRNCARATHTGCVAMPTVIANSMHVRLGRWFTPFP